MMHVNRPIPFVRARWVVLFLGIAVMVVQLMVATHMHADGEEHADCSLCLLSGTLQSPSIHHYLIENPLQHSQVTFSATVLFTGIFFPGFHYPTCGPPRT